MIAYKCPHIQVTIGLVNVGVEEQVAAAALFDNLFEAGFVDRQRVRVPVNTPTKKSGVGAGYAADLLCVYLSTPLSRSPEH
jgi:hypothetical protein